ncbi:YqgE/AlgH family protein [Sphingorhabdus sp. Alg231-15]|uniref:YqgE/AlgH family protein n=1 Tax=Sphingorhabdus sp. Alg231-15 TaxID=1922222 RepID=UPI00307BB1EC
MGRTSQVTYAVTMEDAVYFSGQFLLATPGMADPRFSRSIIAICSHDEHGALGINIGEISTDISFHGILEQFDIEPDELDDRNVFVGGPVEVHRGFILHSLDFNLSDTLQVGDRWGLSSSLDILGAIAKDRGPKKWIAALGYSGWGAGQLEHELTQNGWSVTPGEAEWLYETRAKDKWEMAWQSQGIDPNKLSGQFGSA